ncbi:MAG: hypothetical protein M3540_09360 [Actinomycetota bacterium]|nr:hypothetical protein [Actinomycetota bacterium]
MSRVALAALVGSAVFVASCSLPNAGLFDRGQVGDTPQYRTEGNAFLRGSPALS